MYLNRIVATKQQEVDAYKTSFSIAQAEKKIAQMPPCRGFIQSLTQNKHRAVGLIAEVKKASPSKGLIRADFEPVAIAKSYERAGADCISVLTDQTYFQGHNDDLTQIHQEVRLPLLRKDFIIDAVQIYEARLIGADAILLIAAILSQSQLMQFMQLANQLGLDVLIEIHDSVELQQVLPLAPPLLGINNRNLSTFVTDLSTTKQLTPFIPKGTTVISESGISQTADIAWLRDAGAHGFLIGEHFMRQSNVEQAVYELMGPLSQK